MKLELKHLAPYLPYGVEYFNTHEDFIEQKGIINLHSCFDILRYEYIKPILRPLSDLTKEIEVNGEKLVPMMKILELVGKPNRRIERCKFDGHFIYELGYHYGQEVHGEKNTSWQISECVSENVVSLKTANILFELHFDVFGLIEQGLAVDINTLKKNLK